MQWNSLFVSKQNYLGVIRREVSLSFPFPHGFLLPTSLRAYAVRRCAEIGMIEDLEEEQHKPIIDGFSDNWLPKRITWDEKGRALRVLSPIKPMLMKLHALASDFYTPLSNLVSSTTAERPFLFSNRTPTSLDALIYGHLSLHLFLTLPDPLLRTTIIERHPPLVSYLRKCHEYFEPRNNAVVKKKEMGGWEGLIQGWGVEKGKRFEDLIGVGVMMGGILSYIAFRLVKQT